MIRKPAGNKNFSGFYMTYLDFYKSWISLWLEVMNKNRFYAAIFSNHWGWESLCEWGTILLWKVSAAGLTLCFKMKNAKWSTSEENLSLLANQNKMHQPQHTICILHNLWNRRKRVKNLTDVSQWKVLYRAIVNCWQLREGMKDNMYYLSFLNRNLNRGCLVYMFSLRFLEVNFW